MRNELTRAVELLSEGRQYAPFFEWPDKERKELGVAEEFVASLNEESGLGLCNLQLQRPDPPDLTCKNARGEHVAIEIAEVVCEEAVRRTAKGEGVLRMWRPGSVAAGREHLKSARSGHREEPRWRIRSETHEMACFSSV